MTEMQRHFEEWLKEFRGDSPAKMPASLEYMAWQAWQKAWQASRAELVVKLPEYEFCNHHRNILIDEVKTALDAAGVSYE